MGWIKNRWLSSIEPMDGGPKVKVVEYTIRQGSCPVGSWNAIHTMRLPLVGGAHTERTGRVRAILDRDETVLFIWDWVDRRWVSAKLARKTHMQTKVGGRA